MKLRLARTVAIIVFHLLAGEAAAKLPPCLFVTAELGGESRHDVALETYRTIFDRLGGGLTPEVLREIAVSGDPFSIPDQGDRDVGSLRKTLLEYKRMLAEAELDTPEVHRAFVAELALRAPALDAQKETRGKAGEAAVAGDVSFPELVMPDAVVLQSTAGGSLGIETRYGHTFAYRDGPTGTRSQLDFLDGGPWNTAVSPDGKYVVSVGAGAIEVRHVTGGKFDAPTKIPSPPDGNMLWKRLTKFTYPVGRARAIKAMPDSSRFVLEHPDNHGVNYSEYEGPVAREFFGLTLFDPQTGKKEKIDGSRVWRGGDVDKWGFVPGTDLWYFNVNRTERKTGNRLHTFVIAKLNEKGKLEPVKTVAKWMHHYKERIHTEIEVGGENRLATVTHAKRHKKSVRLWENGEEIDPLENYRGDYAQIESVHLPPKGDHIWIHLAHEGNRYTMARYDVKTRKYDLEVAVPPRVTFALNAEGNGIYYFSDQEFKVVNLDRWEAIGKLP